MTKRKKKRKNTSRKKQNQKHQEESGYEEYLCNLYGFEVIIDYTPGGFPIGIPKEMCEEDYVDDDKETLVEKMQNVNREIIKVVF